MNEKEIEKRLASLADLKIHPREKLENAVLVARGERLYEESLGDKREYIANISSQFEAILNRQDQTEIAKAITEITDIFDSLETDSPLH